MSCPSKRKPRLFVQEVTDSATKLPKSAAQLLQENMETVLQTMEGGKTTSRGNNPAKCQFLTRNRQKQSRRREVTIKLGPPSAHRVSNSDLELRAHSKGLQEHIPNLHRERAWSPLPTNRGNVCLELLGQTCCRHKRAQHQHSAPGLIGSLCQVRERISRLRRAETFIPGAQS